MGDEISWPKFPTTLTEDLLFFKTYLGQECDAVRRFQENILPLINIEFVESDTHWSAISALLSASRRNLSLVDCVSFEVMRYSGFRTAFAFDPHFKEYGFSVIP